MGKHWASVQDWLMEKVEAEYRDDRADLLLAALQIIIPELDNETIERLFDNDLADDEYFDCMEVT